MSELNSVGPEKRSLRKNRFRPHEMSSALSSSWECWSTAGSRFQRNAPSTTQSTALEARSQDEDKGLMTVQEAENILGKQPNGPAVDFQDGLWHYTTKTYTWPGVLTHYTLTAYYTTEKDSRLHHYETEGKKVELPSTSTAPIPAKKKGAAAPKGESGKTGDTGTASAPQAKITPDSKSQPAPPSDKVALPKTDPAGDPAPKEKPAAPSDKTSTPKPATDPPAAKPSQ